MIRAIARVIHGSQPLPPPHASARVYDFAGAVILHRNHERACELSAQCNAAQPNPPDFDDLVEARTRTYAELSGGY